MILVIIILVAWAVILGPNLWKRRSRTVGGISSISHFHRQLRVLEHSSPEPLVAPAYRLRTVDGDGVSGPAADRPEVRAVAPKLTVVGADQLPRPALAFLGEPVGEPPVGSDPAPSPTGTAPASPRPGSPGPTGSGRPTPRPADGHARALARRRRRDTLGVLTLVFVVSLMIGSVSGSTMVWALCLVSGLVLVAYVSLLVRMRQMAEERERKLRYLHPPVAAPDTGDASADRVRADRVSGRYAHPVYQAAAAR
jgi:hypothetical protein